MDKKLLNLNVGSKIKINGKTFIIKELSFHKKPNEFEGAITRYDLNDDYVFEFNDETPHFFQLITKKGWFGFTTTTSKNEEIKSIKIVKNVVKNINYPFVPKSTKDLIPGQFWAILLSNKKFACGRIIQLITRKGKIDSRLFLAGLMDWTGIKKPVSEDLKGKKTIYQGKAHIKTILKTGQQILDYRPLEIDGIEPEFFLDAEGGQNVNLLKGTELIRKASKKELTKYDTISVWGYNVIKILAEKQFVKDEKKTRKKKI